MNRTKHRVMAGTLAIALAVLAALTACGGDDEDVSQFQKAADSLMSRRDTAVARMDSAGMLQPDTLSSDTTRKRDTTRRDTTRRTP